MTVIDGDAFEGCSGLKSIHLPEGVTEIGRYAFYCSGLESVTLPGSLKTVSYSLFRDCDSLKTAVLSEGVTAIEDSAFEECPALTSVTLPSTLTYIGYDSFREDTSLEKIVIPEGVEKIDSNAFYECEKLREISLPESLVELQWDVFGDTAYYNDKANWEDGLLYLDGWMLAGKEDCVEVTVKEGTHGIEAGALECNQMLKSVTVPDSVLYVGDFAFYGCAALEEVTLPSDLVWLGEAVVDQTAYYADEKNWEGDVLYFGTWAADSKETITEAHIKEGTLALVDDLFYNRKDLLTITIPDGVTHIGESMFGNCESLTEVVFPAGVTELPDYLFDECVHLKSVTLPETLTTIGKAAFYDCRELSAVTVPEGVTVIPEFAFAYCEGLETVDIPDTVTEIGDLAFTDCGKLKAVSIPRGVERIGVGTFRYCRTLTEIFLPDTVTVIDQVAFEDCCGLTFVAIPESVTWISEDAFDGAGEFTVHGAAGSAAEALAEAKDAPFTLHVYEKDLSSDGQTHWYACEICGSRGEETAHSGGSATCLEKAVCEVCDTVYGELAPHTYVEVPDAAYFKSAATCTSPAVYCVSCSLCKAAGEETFLCGEPDKDNHAGGTCVDGAKEATCTEEGYTGDTCCAGCHAVLEKGKSIEKLPHTYAKEWTADEDGHWHECACGDKAEAAAHEFCWVTDRAATGTQTGLKHEECAVCGYTRNEDTETPRIADVDGDGKITTTDARLTL